MSDIKYIIDDCNNLFCLPIVRWQMPSRRHVVVCERPLRSCEDIYTPGEDATMDERAAQNSTA